MIEVTLPEDDFFNRCERTENGYKLVIGPVGHGPFPDQHVYSENPLLVRERHERYAAGIGYTVERQEYQGQLALLLTKPPGGIYKDRLLITYSYQEPENT